MGASRFDSSSSGMKPRSALFRCLILGCLLNSVAACSRAGGDYVDDPVDSTPSPDPPGSGAGEGDHAPPPPFVRSCIGGVNVAGAEFGDVPGVHGHDYIYPTPEEAGFDPAHWYAERGLGVFRLPIRWERIQPVPFEELDEDELGRLQRAVEYYAYEGIIIVDLHNYGRYENELVTGPADTRLADVWVRIAGALPSRDNIVLGLMNEPHGVSADDWTRTAQAAIDALRSDGFGNTVLVSGAYWSGAHSWNRPGDSNANAMLSVSDPAGRLVFEAHQYLDFSSSGSSDDCVSAEQAVQRLQPFTDWLARNERHGFLGEFAASEAPACLTALTAMLEHMRENREYVGWTYWATGPWWPPDDPFTIMHDTEIGAAQSALLETHSCRGLED